MEGLRDSCGRTIDYLRISLTDRCNLRCSYCMPREGISALKHEEILTLEEVYRVAEVMTGMGIRRIRLTGGEPLVRRNVMSLVKRLRKMPGAPELSLTTNGVLLEEHLEELAEAGVRNINISLDTLNRETYQRLTGADALEKVEKSIHRALGMDLQVKINSVLIRGINDGEISSLAELAKDLPVSLRFIELMPIGCGKAYQGVSKAEILEVLEEKYGPAEPLQNESRSEDTGEDLRKGKVGEAGNEIKLQGESGSIPEGCGPADYVHFPGFAGNVGFIDPLSHSFCASCNRVRLTADGRLKLCLYYAKGPELLPLLRRECSDEELRDVIRKAILEKPERHCFGSRNTASESRTMNQIGG